MKIHSAASREVCLDRLAQLDVRSAEASFPADKDGFMEIHAGKGTCRIVPCDKDLVLSKIENVEDFNSSLQDLMLHRLESFLQTSQARSAAALFDEVVLAVVNVTM